MSKINIIPIFVPHLGCPNDCVFCNQRRITGVENFSIEDAKEKIEVFLTYFENSNKPIEIAFYGGSFTSINEKLQIELLKIAKSYKEQGLIDKIRLSTRPDCINEKILSYLKEHKVDIIELGIQSLDEEVLLKSKRGHNVSCVSAAVKLIREFDFTLGLQQMVGLPSDSMEKSIETTKKIIELNPDFVRIYPTLVIKNTELADMFLNKEYRPLELDEAVEIVTRLIMLYNCEHIEIIRVGLQATENLKFDKDVLAGPLHDAFRELCESKKLLILLKNSQIKGLNSENLLIEANNRTISLLVGQRAINKEVIKSIFNVKSLSFKGNNSLDNKIRFNDKYLIDIEKSIDNIVKGW